MHPLPRPRPRRSPLRTSSRRLHASPPRTSAWKASLLPSLTSNTVPTDTFHPSPSSSHSHPSSSLPDRIVALGVPFVKQDGFTLQAVLRGLEGAEVDEDIKSLGVGRETLEALFPDQKVATFSGVFQELGKRVSPFRRPTHESPSSRSAAPPFPSNDAGTQSQGTVALRRALVQAWLDEGRRTTARHVRALNLTIEKDGDEGLVEGFKERLRWNTAVPRSSLVDALALLISRPPSPASFPLPHLLPSLPLPTPYFNTSLSLSTSLLQALHDPSPSQEWQMRRLRYGLVWMGVEVGSLKLDGSEREVEGLIRGLLGRAERTATGLRNTSEFVDYVRRSQLAIFRSFGL